MNLLRELGSKPWEQQGAPAEADFASADTRRSARTGLYMLLAALSVMFFLFSVSHQWRTEYADWKVVDEPGLLWFNTALLLAASFALQWGSTAAAEAATKRARWLLVSTCLLSAGFLAGQWLAWEEMLDAGLYASGNPANAYFYLFTGLHALHLGVGLWFLLVATLRVLRSSDVAAEAARVGLCATYWHFLFLVWLLLFYLLLST